MIHIPFPRFRGISRERFAFPVLTIGEQEERDSKSPLIPSSIRENQFTSSDFSLKKKSIFFPSSLRENRSTYSRFLIKNFIPFIYKRKSVQFFAKEIPFHHGRIGHLLLVTLG